MCISFVGDVNVHHEEWLGSSTTTVHGGSRAALDFASSSGCEWMVTEPTHIDGGMCVGFVTILSTHLVSIDRRYL